MSARDPLATPTLKIATEDLLRAAREADARARAADMAGLPSTKRPAPPEADIEVSVDIADDKGEIDALLDGTSGAIAVTDPPNDHSDIRPVARKDEGPALSSVPCVVASKEDLSWFELEATSEEVLASIDGESSVEAIVLKLKMPREQALSILAELRSHGVVEFR
jgi:hypothetical protein